MAVINPGDLTFSGEEIRSFAEATIEQMVEYPALTDMHTVIPGIITDRQIPLLGHLSKITRKDLGCGLGKLDKTIPMSEKYWRPINFKIWLSECWQQFEDTFMVYYLNVGGEKSDLTTTQIFSQWLIEEVGDAAAKDALRIAWFADTAAALSTGAGVFSPDVNVLDYNMFDGFFKQLFAITTANAARRTPIAKNQGASYTLQTFDDTDTTNKVATGIFLKLTMKAHRVLRANANKVIWSTRSLTDQYILERMAVPNISESYVRTESGIDTLKINGVTIMVNDQWDDVIAEDQDNGVKWNLPHRAVMSTKDNLPVGFDNAASVTDFDVFYDKMSETSNIKALYRMDAKVLEDNLIQFAY